jgi:hypothetical protein
MTEEDGALGVRRGASAELLRRVDEDLLSRVASLPAGSQRWLKTAIQAIRNAQMLSVEEPAEEPRRRPAAAPAEEEEPKPRAASLEDVITGKADLRKHLESYPELAEELDGMADIIDVLRDLGERRRRIGERILREEILGEPPEEEEEAPEEEPEEGYEG